MGILPQNWTELSLCKNQLQLHSTIRQLAGSADDAIHSEPASSTPASPTRFTIISQIVMSFMTLAGATMWARGSEGIKTAIIMSNIFDVV